MISSLSSITGILLSTIGTILTLWTILTTDNKIADTYGELADRHKQFPREKRKAQLGCILIAVDGMFQIVA